MKKIRIAQIGINRYSHGPDIFVTLKAQPELYDIAGYALVEDERETCAGKLGVFEGYPELTLEEILSDPTIEAVAVETDEIHLLTYALMAVRAGKHIHMEKPGSQNLADFTALVEEARARGTVLHLGYMYRYNPILSQVVEKAQNGTYGEIFSVEAHMSRLDGTAVRSWLSSFQGGMMFYLGCHLIDLILRIQGMPDEILPMNCTTDPEGLHTEDFAFAVFKYKNGLSFLRTSGREVDGFARRQLVITGTRGTVEVKPLEISLPRTPEHHYALATGWRESLDGSPATQGTSDVYDRYADMMRAFASYVRGEKTNPYTLDYELELFKVVLACCGM
ncbi:MAG: Gfo/Idh/MocA family oxidoreductase [Clostridia bacterium]|nr:Gfo/Idh/MocA family oxidoreductase [Clostridia bacterium]